MSINMSSAYGLLPSDGYFKASQDPVITFDPSIDNVNNFRKVYGNSITSSSVLSDFLSGKDGRIAPSYSDINDPSIGNGLLMGQAQSDHVALDNWIPPQTLQVYEIAGWGENTTSGITYKGKQDCFLGNIGCTGYSLDREPIETIDGDKVVVVASANSLNESTGKYFLNLRAYNSDTKSQAQHANIMDVSYVDQFLGNLIKNSTSTVSYITLTKPQETKRLEVSVHSPVSVDVYDNNGNHTGLVANQSTSSDFETIEENIPNSSYEEFGEGKYLSLDPSGKYSFVLKGQDTGTFTLDIDTKIGTTTLAASDYLSVPVSTSTTAKFNLAPNATTTSLSVDFDGDGKTDQTIQPNNKLDPKTSLKALEGVVLGLKMNVIVKALLLLEIKNLENNSSSAKTEKVINFIITTESNISKINKIYKLKDLDKIIGILEKIRLILTNN